MSPTINTVIVRAIDLFNFAWYHFKKCVSIVILKNSLSPLGRAQERNLGNNFNIELMDTLQTTIIMKPEDLLNEDFLKQFKTRPELTSFLEQLHKRGIEMILEGELDPQLEYDKYQNRENCKLL